MEWSCLFLGQFSVFYELDGTIKLFIWRPLLIDMELIIHLVWSTDNRFSKSQPIPIPNIYMGNSVNSDFELFP